MCWQTDYLLGVMCFGAPTVQLVGETTKGPKYPTEVGRILKSEKQVLSFFIIIIMNIILGRRIKVSVFSDVRNDDVKKLYQDSTDRNE